MRGAALLALVGGGAAIAWLARRSLAQRDATFMTRTAQVNLAEITLAHLALEHSRQEPVLQYARLLLRHHQDAQRSLKNLSRMLGVSLPRRPDSAQQEQSTRLRQLGGQTFDRAFVEAMISGHVRAIAMFEHEAHEGQDPLVRAYARRVLPHLEEHLTLARRLERHLRHAAAAI
ncbi:MAG TPA: DUF4142 domain-containing protein [Oscillatoriaceae cyanobacterium]